MLSLALVLLDISRYGLNHIILDIILFKVLINVAHFIREKKKFFYRKVYIPQISFK